MVKVDLQRCVEELMKYTLISFITGTLKSDLWLPKAYCSELLREDFTDSATAASSSGEYGGVPAYPLYKRLAMALYESVSSGVLFCRGDESLLFKAEDTLKLKENEWGILLSDSGSKMINALDMVNFELHVQEPFFSYLRDGLKVVEGRIGPGAKLLLNQCVMLEVQDVHRYESFSEMLNSEGLSRVLPGVETIEEGKAILAFSTYPQTDSILPQYHVKTFIGKRRPGVQVYRRFYTETEEKSFGVLAIQVKKPADQPFNFLATILSGLSFAGIQHLLGLTHTVGTISEALPPPKSTLLSSFMLPCNPNATGSTLSHGARALAKHANRDSSNYWGTSNGNDSDKNRQALDLINNMLSHCFWLNIHVVPPHGDVFEIRVSDGYGARWTKDGSQFIGFLEPYMEDGHTKGWKH